MKRLSTKVVLHLVVLLIVLLLGSCYQRRENPKKTQNTSKSIGKYVYISTTGILHIDNDCFNLKYPREGTAEKAAGKFMELTRLTDNSFDEYCFRCVDEKAYEKIQSLLDENDKEINWEDYRVD